MELCDVDRTPALYNLVCNGDKIPMFLQGGDRLTVSSVGRVVHNYTVEGSEESELLRRFYQPFVAGMQRLDALSSSPETYKMTDEEMLEKGVTSLPGSLREAVDHLEKSEFMREVLGDHLHAALVENKKAEWDAYRTQVTEWEIERYLPIL